jgi:hypothetical protein
VEDFPEFVARMGDLMRRPYDWSEGRQDPEADHPAGLRRQRHASSPSTSCASTSCSAGFCATAGWDGSGVARHRLAILPGVTHYAMSDAPGLIDTALAFLASAEG